MSEFALAIRVLMALVFLTAALGKFRHREAFQGVVANYRLLPQAVVPVFSALLPTIEATFAVTLMFADSAAPAMGCAALLLLFAAAMVVNLRRGRRHIDCGCFQSLFKQTLSWKLVARNAGLATLLIWAASVPVRELSAVAAGEAALAGTVLFVLLQSLNILWSVVPAWRPRDAVTQGAGK